MKQPIDIVLASIGKRAAERGECPLDMKNRLGLTGEQLVIAENAYFEHRFAMQKADPTNQVMWDCIGDVTAEENQVK